MVQHAMSAERTPILSGTIPCFEMFMTTWEQLGSKNPDMEPYIEVGLDRAVKYYEKMDQTRAYVVSMGMTCYCFFCGCCAPSHDLKTN
jgi:hypothetical protein